MTKHLDWAVNTANTFMSEADAEGYHPELAKRWAYVPGMMLLAFGRLAEQTGDERYYEFMKRHMDLFVQPDGMVRTYAIEEYNLDQVNQGKVLFPLLRRTGEKWYEQAAHLLSCPTERTSKNK